MDVQKLKKKLHHFFSNLGHSLYSPGVTTFCVGLLNPRRRGGSLQVENKGMPDMGDTDEV